LLEKRANIHSTGTWGPPGGHIDYGEMPELAAERETLEETGVNISNITFTCVTNDVFEAEHKHYITLWFEADYQAGEAQIKAPKEESEVGWFRWDALPQPLFLPFQHFLEGKIYRSPAMQERYGQASASSHEVAETLERLFGA
jgi:8-oxo-dGTP diphosphatase